MKRSGELERSAAIRAAEFMAAAARTAPKGRGIDNIEVILIDDEAEKKKLISTMEAIAAKENRPSLARDAGNISLSPAIIIIGVRSNPAGLNCGFCGYSTCDNLKKTTGICSFNSIDLGIATGSAIEIASSFHMDNRIMYSVGRAALDLKLFTPDVKEALGIPLSVTGKNPYFDRK